MAQNKFHKSFKLNNQSFLTVDELLAFSNQIHKDIAFFLEDWFSKSNTVKVQTSGSTGKPKSILLQTQQMVNSALATGTFFNKKENTKALLCLPSAYIAGKMMLVRALTLGWHLDVVAPNSDPLKDNDKSYDFAAMVPLQVQNSLTKLNQIKELIVGGGVVSSQLQQKIQKVTTKVFATYGMTETITHIAIKKLNHFSDFNLTSIGKSFYEALPEVEIFIDERHCLVINAPKIANNLVITNDVVNLISDTKFEWLGRFDNVINSGGIKLHPEKIEEKLTKSLANRFFVAGIPDEKLGQKLVLIIEGHQQNLNLEKSNLSKFEYPKEVYFLDKFAETETKKIQRKKTLDFISF